jgi:uncharacterized protein YbbK (DUF523 family)
MHLITAGFGGRHSNGFFIMFAIPIFDACRFFCANSAAGQLTIAASSCLTGAAVRYDGASKTLPLLLNWPQQLVRILPICPEVGAGLAVPRPPVQLVVSDRAPRARGRDLHALDVTNELERFAQSSIQQLANEPALCGYIWKSRSPSCGLNSTPLFSDQGAQIGVTSGIQAQLISTHMPWLAHIEESCLETPAIAARFLLQCRWVFDLRNALAQETQALPAWHRHYAFLWRLLSQNLALRNSCAELQRLAELGDWQNYLATLHRAGENVEAEQLLGLFVNS